MKRRGDGEERRARSSTLGTGEEHDNLLAMSVSGPSNGLVTAAL